MHKHLISLIFVICAAIGAYLYFKPVYPNSEQAKQLYQANQTAIAGNPEGAVTIVEFFAYRCLFCRQEDNILNKILAKHKNVRLIYKGYALFGQTSYLPLTAALAAFKQGPQPYLTLHRLMLHSPSFLDKNEIEVLAKAANLDIFQWRKDIKNPAYLKHIHNNNHLVESLAVKGAPTLFFAETALLNDLAHINRYKQRRYTGFMSLDKVEHYIQAVS